ncbi:hypothetical protein FE392_04165 [Xenorhabdus sp. 12]|uniref:Transposase n=1 Tax=Xenorhabdus santafensis TaxID=2582833 RepID=A0ABU4S5P3_9GAMM|nr:hypothetical protein [Xenorhabdus sp. 12]MDX7986532.1 hypothetical protein [Xenorhabdus sp. 12]
MKGNNLNKLVYEALFGMDMLDALIENGQHDLRKKSQQSIPSNLNLNIQRMAVEADKGQPA